uniref:IF rod domain-containing protein n=1 Tax=Piliocolobus tephrosceles TaxID=591936 RepID=A0A8C9ITM6_9PRIM
MGSPCEELKATVQKHMQSLRPSREDLNRLNQAIQRLTVEMGSAESQPCELGEAKDPPALQEEGGSGSAKGKLAWLEAALQRAKQDVTQQLCEYRELMILKRGLDFEIASYHKLLEGEESGAFLPWTVVLRFAGPRPGLRPPTPAPAGSSTLETSAPGGGYALCGSPGCGCVGRFSCWGSLRC